MLNLEETQMIEQLQTLSKHFNELIKSRTKDLEAA
jgi:hypothetical protein